MTTGDDDDDGDADDAVGFDRRCRHRRDKFQNFPVFARPWMNRANFCRVRLDIRRLARFAIFFFSNAFLGNDSPKKKNSSSKYYKYYTLHIPVANLRGVR